MQNRLTRRKKLANDKLRLLVNILLILVVAGLNFEAIPNINTYINSNRLNTNFSQPQVKASFTNQDLTQEKTAKTVIQVKAAKKWNKKYTYLRLTINSADDTKKFAKNMQTSADFIINQLHENNLEPKQVSINVKNDNNFEQFGYSLLQFATLIDQRYYANNSTYLSKVEIAEKVIHFLAGLVTLISLIALVWLIAIPRGKIVLY